MNMTCTLKLIHRSREAGAALAISLVFLLLLTIIGITATTTSRLEEKMSGNTRDLSVSTQLAESGYRAAAAWVFNQAGTGNRPGEKNTTPGANEIWTLGTAGGGALADQTASWWMANAIEYGVANTKEFVSPDSTIFYQANEDPRFVIEGYGFLSDDLAAGSTAGRDFYRNSGYGAGLTGRAQTLIQGTVFTRYN
jgi:type IV pilus assembly protein PilX